jgi:competence protein ComGC
MTDATHPLPAQRPVEPPRDLLTWGMIEALRGTKPWVRFLSILGFIVAGFMVVMALGMGGFGLYTTSRSGAEGLILVGLAFFYLLMGILYIFPSRFLFRYASAIDEALHVKAKSGAVERALRHQRSFWKFAGIMALVTLLLYVPGVIAAIAVPNLLTAMQRAKQKRTVADLRSIASSLEAFAVDKNYYPNVTSIDELVPLLEPTYINPLPRLDGWGTPFVYMGDGCYGTRCNAYYLASGGRNGSLENDSLKELGHRLVTTKTFDDDIVFGNGSFLRAPEGVSVER